jgi:hypothetical protein
MPAALLEDPENGETEYLPNHDLNLIVAHVSF